jgi:hypothetical protein
MDKCTRQPHNFKYSNENSQKKLIDSFSLFLYKVKSIHGGETLRSVELICNVSLIGNTCFPPFVFMAAEHYVNVSIHKNKNDSQGSFCLQLKSD